ncbi:SusC/RagA family TonB-linked outer membrane protein [Sinomicrobium kalidii]|uniref:TonB-dependent receptor n=1 Tax=Sinomicrobium kalidii TaxID=2900738 RepID=UPI001E623532|nr:TonB-dependent receptor [Sinomicrobium kalidii]UGU17433.1 SusC/RagA family TonB-linked outer membrane protein [Sinomicrobium kalidii]
MKKQLQSYENPGWEFDIDLRMKLTFLFIIITIFAIHADPTYSQGTKISIHMEQVTVSEVFNKIESLTEFKFIFKTKDVDLQRKVSVNAEKKDILKILEILFPDKNVHVEIIDRKILIKRKKDSSSPGSGILPDKKNIQFAVNGTVRDENGLPLAGANILEKGRKNGTQTDFDGKFTLEVNSDEAVLVISFLGFATQEIDLDGESEVEIILKEDSAALDEVVVIGFGTEKKRDLTGSVASADVEAFSEFPNPSIAQTLQGSVTGLNVGAVTSAGREPEISVRGRTTINGNRDVFVVLDGIPYSGSIADLNPNDIKSITVLKDPSSKAIYGAQSANGVILVESRKGARKNSKPVITYSSSYTTQIPSNELRLLDRDGFIEKSYDYDFEQAYEAPDYTNLKPDISYIDIVNDPELRKGFENGTDYDWWENATNPGFIMTHDLSVQGNDGKTSYLLSGNYTDQRGFIINDKFNRKSVRLNIETGVTDWLSVGARSAAIFSDLSGNSPNLNAIRFMTPLVEPRDEAGELILNPNGTQILNPFVTVLADDLEHRNTLIGNFFADIDLGFIPGLNYRINYGNSYYWNKYFQSNRYANARAGSAFKRNTSKYDWTLDNIFTYKRKFAEKHDINLTFLFGRRGVSFEGSKAEGSNFSNLRLGYNDLNQAAVQEIFSSGYKEDYLYQMGRVNYVYDEKYLLTATLRRDGFSGFAKNNKIAMFPSLALGWNISRESFFKSEWINNFKVRGSYGVSGNLVDRYSSLARINSFPAIVFGDGGTTEFGQEVQNLSNPNLGWEKTKGFNFGTDFSLFDFRLNGSIDYYFSHTSDLIFDVSIPQITGFDNITTNVGEVRNYGFEIILEGKIIRTDAWKWNMNFNFSLNRNEIVSLVNLDANHDGQEEDLVSSGLFIGESINAIYGYESEGIIQIGDDVPDGFLVGTHRIKDQNEDGKITPDDRIILGRREPSYRFSIFNEIGYKNLSLRFFINAVQGGKNGYLDGNEPNFGGGDNGRRRNIYEGIDYWTPSNPDAKYRRLDQAPATDYTHYDSRSFIRLQDVSLAYSFDSEWLRSNGIGSMKFFLSGKNLLTITDWNGWDPETGAGIQVGARPLLKGLSLGVNISL